MYKFLIMLIIAMSLPHSANSEKKALTLQGVERKFEKLKTNLAKRKKHTRQIKKIVQFKKYLKESLKQVETQSPEQTLLFYRLTSLDIYFEQIPSSAFNLKRCPALRARVIFSFSPKNDSPSKDEIPQEAKEALDVLTLLCEQKQ